MPPLGLAYIASYLRKYNSFNDTIIIDKVPNKLKAILQARPSIVGISSVTDGMKDAIKLAKEIKETFGDVPIILGGHHIGLAPDNLPEPFDIGVIGEGEETMSELLRMYQMTDNGTFYNLKDIKGISYRENGKVIVNERRPLIKDIDTIPYPARDLFDMEGYYLKPRKTFSSIVLGRGTQMLTSRGCFFSCCFCSSALFWRRKTRMHSAKYVIGEIKELVEKYKVEGLYIVDDLFAFNTERLTEIADEIVKSGIKLNLKIATRVSSITPENVKQFKRMGIQTACVGYESGSQKTLDYLKKGTQKVSDGVIAAKLLNDNGISNHGYFMFGAPGETREDMMETIQFIKDNNITSFNICAVTPYPGTELWEYAKSKGLVSDDMDFSKLNLHPTDKNFILVNDQMSREEFLEMNDMFLKLGESKMNAIDFKFSQLLSINMMKRAIKQPKKAIKLLYYSTKRKVFK